MLPGPNPASETAFIQNWMNSDDIDGLVLVITEAITAKRPQLAARLVGLLDDAVEIEPGSALERAKNAARFFLLKPKETEHLDAFEAAWAEARRKRIRKIKTRMRNRLMGRPPRKR